MEDKVLILPVDSQTFEIENYSINDTSLISTIDLDTNFSQSTDYIEYYIFDENKNLIYPSSTKELLTYTVRDGHVLLDPKQDLQREDFNEGVYYINYNFYKKLLNSSITSKYYIEEISSDRTEVRLNSNTISNDDLQSSTQDFIQYRNSQDYFVDFYLNFGDNNLIIANNIKLEVINEEDYSIIIKLYEPLPSDFNLKSQCWVIETKSTSQSYQVQFPVPIFDPQDFEYIAGPNLDLNIKNESGISSQEYSYNTLLNSNITSSNNQIQSLLDDKGLKININYEDFNNFIKFSSAEVRLENFVYKVGLIENYNNQITLLNDNIVSSTNLTNEFVSSTSTFDIKIKDIIKNFDSYERFLYFDSGSSFSYPKTNSTPTYTLASTTSTEVKTWLGSSNNTSLYYGGLALQAYDFDQNNQDYLYWNIPEYLRDDPNNSQYTLFIDMVGQHFDNIWIYTKDIVNKFNADNRLDYGISKDLVSDAIKDFGIKLYSNNFNTKDLYEAFLGITPSGITFPSTGSELIDTQITASSDIIPLDDTNKRLYKRIYHNIPYLLKTKGTIAGLRALITSYGIPDTILRISEFGGKNPTNKQDWSHKQNVFNHSLELDGSSYFSSSFRPNTNFSTSNPNTVQFRFKTPGLPENQIDQTLLSIGEYGTSLLVLEYTGSSNTSGSYSGSISDPYKEYGTLKFIPNTITPSISASINLPIFDNKWWSVMTTQNGLTASLSVANKIDNKVGFSNYSEITGYNPNSYNSSTKITFPHPSNLTFNSKNYTPFSGSIQEVRYYTNNISASSFEDFVLNPYSFKGNGFDTSDSLTFRADLGTLSKIGSRESIHPKITGSWLPTSSFNDGTSNFYLSNESFTENREYIHLNEPHQGIKNKVTDRISISENIIPQGDTLSVKRSIQQYSYLTQSASPDADYLEVAFSPTDQIDDDIIAELGNFNIGDYIGDPRHMSESRINYPDLDTLRDKYFLKYIKSYNVKDFIRLIKYFDNSLFKMIKDFTPARTNLSSGVVVKQHILERNAYSSQPLSWEDQTYSGSVKSFARDYETGSIEVFKGGTGGIFERFNGLEFHKSGSDGNGPDNRFGITQSWYDVYQSTESNNIIYPRDDQREFYNGEFSQSMYIKLQRGKDHKNDDPCYDYLNWENTPELLYRLEYFSGSDDLYSVNEFTPIPPQVLNEYYTNFTELNGSDLNNCITTGSISIYSNVSNIANIVEGTKFYSDVTGELPWNGGEKYYSLREKNIIFTTLNTSGSNYLNNLALYPGGPSYKGSKFTGSYNTTNINYTSISNYGGNQDGTGATFDITTNNGLITSINTNDTGSGYSLQDHFSFSSNDLGGSRLIDINHILSVTPIDLNNNYATGSYTLSPSSNTSTTATNQEWQIEFTEVIPNSRKGRLSRLTSTNVGEGVKVGDTFTWTSTDINNHILNTIGAPITSSIDTLLTSITTQPVGGVEGVYTQVGLTGSLNGRGAEARFDLDVNGDIFGLTVLTTGSGYVIDETITIPSSSLGATAGGGTDAIITLTSTDLDLNYISNGIGDYTFTVPANGVNSNNNHLDEDIVYLYIKGDNFIYEEEDTKNRFTSIIDSTGTMNSKINCKYLDYYSVTQPSFFTPLFTTVPVPSPNPYSIGDQVKINGMGDDCWTILSRIETPSLLPPEDQYIVSGCVTPPPSLYDVSLKYSLSSNTVCSQGTNSYKSNNLYLNLATEIYTTDGTTLASDGWYSSGNIKRSVVNGILQYGSNNCDSTNIDLSGLDLSGLDFGGPKIICNELYKQGYLSENLWDADERYGDMLFAKDPKLIIGYQMWARKVVKYMRNNPQNTKYLYRIVKPWTEYMGYEMGVIDKQNYIGKLFHKIVSLPTYLLFHLGGGKRLLNLYNYKKFKKNIG